MATTFEQLRASVETAARSGLPSLTVSYENAAAAGRALGVWHAYAGRRGGWIYTPEGRAVCQGWAALACQRGCKYDPERRGWTIPFGTQVRTASSRDARLAREQVAS